MSLLNSVQTTINELPLILQLDVAGNPHCWINYCKSAYYYTKDLVAWEAAPAEFTLYGGNSRITGEQSTLTMNTIVAIKGKVNEKQYHQMNRVPLTNKALFRRDHGICGYCGAEFALTSKHLSRDHIHPTSKGGPNKWTNVVTACHSCNKRKSDRTVQQAGMQLLYVPYAPNRSEYLLLSNRRIIIDQMEFLKKRLPKESRAFKLQC